MTLWPKKWMYENEIFTVQIVQLWYIELGQADADSDGLSVWS